MKKKQWNIAPACPQQAQALSEDLGLSPLAASVLAARGMNPQTGRAFLDSAPSHLADPFLLADMDKAVAAIEQAIARGDKIAIYGDYDVDGVTATTLLIQYLRGRGVCCEYYIPDRINEGYGLNPCAIRCLVEQGCKLMITVDSGITAVEEAKLAGELGLGLIITDHHECKDALPQALAVVNPRRADSAYAFRELAGVGVAFKLVCALEKHRPVEELLDEYADIVAVGTVADVMPLVEENRTIVTWGLGRLAQTQNQGMRMLMQKLGIEGQGISSNAISFTMAPRINAAGRMGGADKAVELFLAQSPQQAQGLADYLCELNRQRQVEENEIYQQLVSQLNVSFDSKVQKAILLWGENWHNGVIGIVASRLADRFGVPTVLISLDGQQGKGSGRSTAGFNLYAALESCSDLLEKYGGHELAVGLTVHADQLERLQQKFYAYAMEHMAQGEVLPLVQVDCLVEPGQINQPSIESLAKLEPFGMGNPQPLFCMRGMRIEELTPISSDRHTKFILSQGEHSFCAFLFGVGGINCPFVCGDEVDIVFSAEINHFRGRTSVQLVLKDMVWSQPEQAQDERSLALYRQFAGGDPLESRQALQLSPTRDELVAVFRHVKAHAQQSKLLCRPRTLYRRIRYESARGMNLGKLLVCLDVFDEFSIFDCRLWGDQTDITVLNRQDKADINGSQILGRLLQQANTSEG